MVCGCVHVDGQGETRPGFIPVFSLCRVVRWAGSFFPKGEHWSKSGALLLPFFDTTLMLHVAMT